MVDRRMNDGLTDEVASPIQMEGPCHASWPSWLYELSSSCNLYHIEASQAYGWGKPWIMYKR